MKKYKFSASYETFQFRKETQNLGLKRNGVFWCLHPRPQASPLTSAHLGSKRGSKFSLCCHCLNAAFSLADEFCFDLNVHFDPSNVHFDPFLECAFLGGRRLES